MKTPRPFRMKRFVIEQSHASMKVGTDSDLLGTMAYGGDHILDIGTGTGVLALMMAQRYPDSQLMAIEIDAGAIIDATTNFAASPWAARLSLRHTSLQDYVEQCSDRYDAIVCNPPYFDKSLECPDPGRRQARHTSSLPFDQLIDGVGRLLSPCGYFSVILPPEVKDSFCLLCAQASLTLTRCHNIHTMPDRDVKRHVLIFQKIQTSSLSQTCTQTHFMYASDGSITPWYRELIKDFLIGIPTIMQKKF